MTSLIENRKSKRALINDFFNCEKMVKSGLAINAVLAHCDLPNSKAKRFPGLVMAAMPCFIFKALFSYF